MCTIVKFLSQCMVSSSYQVILLYKCQKMKETHFTVLQNQGCTAGGSYKSLVNFWLIIQTLCYWHSEYQVMLVIHQYQNIDTHTSTYQYILYISTSKCQNKNEKENRACWCEFLVNKLAAYSSTDPISISYKFKQLKTVKRNYNHDERKYLLFHC
jgi:hypothetical protein